MFLQFQSIRPIDLVEAVKYHGVGSAQQYCMWIEINNKQKQKFLHIESEWHF